MTTSSCKNSKLVWEAVKRGGGGGEPYFPKYIFFGVLLQLVQKGFFGVPEYETVSYILIFLQFNDCRLHFNNLSLSEAQAAAKKAQEGKTAAASYCTIQVLFQVTKMYNLKLLIFKCNVNVIDSSVILPSEILASSNFSKNLNLVTWIGAQPYIQILLR